MCRLDHLLCLVFSTAPPVALRQGLHLAATYDATLHVMPIGWGDRAFLLEALRNERRRRGDAASVDTRIVPAADEGPLQAIRRYRERINVDLLVVDSFAGCRGEPPLADEATRSLIEQFTIPLFLVDRCGEPESVQRLLVPTDLSDQSFETLKHATELATCYDASIVLLHVLDTSPYVALTPIDRLSLGSTTLSEHRARRRLRQFVQQGGTADVPIHTRLAFGDPATHIARAVNEEAADLLVLSSHAVVGQATHALGPVADRVLRRVTCPLLLVRTIGASLRSAEEARTNAKGPPE